MLKVVISELMHEAGVEKLKQDFDVLYDPTLAGRPEELKAAALDASALVVRSLARVSEATLTGAERLKVVARLGVGLDNIDLQACERRGIIVCPATGANALSVAEYVVAVTLMLVRGSYLSSHEVAAGKWPREDLMGFEITGKRVGIIGLGATGTEVASRLHSLGMIVSANDPFIPADLPKWQNVQRLNLDELLQSADVVTLHVPLKADTRHLINEARLSQMKASAILINASRGSVVDADALIAALKNKRLRGAALDVFEDEPLSKKAGDKFAELDNVILTPHIAGVTQESNLRTSMIIAQKVRQVLLDDG